MNRILCLIFFASGAAALIFETLWFRQAGLALGNSIWTPSLVLAGFMGGLALGNLLVARRGDRFGNPVRAYAFFELAIGVSGLALVLGLPHAGAWFAGWMRPLVDQPWILNPTRLLVAFALLLIPSTAMGATLPLLTMRPRLVYVLIPGKSSSAVFNLDLSGSQTHAASNPLFFKIESRWSFPMLKAPP